MDADCIHGRVRWDCAECDDIETEVMKHCTCERSQEAADVDDLTAWVTDGCPVHGGAA